MYVLAPQLFKNIIQKNCQLAKFIILYKVGNEKLAHLKLLTNLRIVLSVCLSVRLPCRLFVRPSLYLLCRSCK